jgi:hypothetical protein
VSVYDTGTEEDLRTVPLPGLRKHPRVRRHQALAGYLIVELEGVPWDFWLRDANDRIIFCGEIGHVRYVLSWIAARVMVREIFADAVEELARRVGVELHSSLRAIPRETQREGVTP